MAVLPADGESLAKNDVLGMLDGFIEGKDPEEAVAKKTVEGDSDEPKSGEPEAVEAQGEAESESDDKPEADEAESEDLPQKVKVKVDGQELEVTLDEALAGYSREADYTRKNQALAEERANWDAIKDQSLAKDREAIAAEREKYKAVLGIWETQFKDALGDNIDWNALRAQNPGEWSARMTERYDTLNKLNAVKAERERLDAEESYKKTAAQQQKLAAEAQKLLTAVPDWKSPEKYTSDMGKIRAYAQGLGWNDQELSELANQGGHRLLLMARDAAAYRALQNNKPVAQQKVEAAKPLQPGAATQPTTKGSRLAKLLSEQAKRGDKNTTVALLDQLFG